MTRVRYEQTRYLGIRKRISGRTVTYQARWSDLEGRQRSGTRDTLRAAIELRDEMVRRANAGELIDLEKGARPLGEIVLPWLQAQSVSESTKATELSYYHSRIDPKWGRVPLNRISRPAIEDWITELQATSLRPSTVSKVYRIFAKGLRAALEDTPLDDPTRRIKAPKEPRHDALFLTADQVELLLDLIDPYWRLAVQLLVETGLRIGELAALRVADVDFDDHAVIVTKTLTRGRTGTSIGGPKTRAGRRRVPTVSDETLERLARMISARDASGDELLIIGQRGGAFSPGNFRNRAWAAVMESGAWTGPQASPHALRHTAISRWIATNRVTPLEVSRWAGHSSITITYDEYGHLFPAENTGVREALAEMRNEARSRFSNQD